MVVDAPAARYGWVNTASPFADIPTRQHTHLSLTRHPSGLFYSKQRSGHQCPSTSPLAHRARKPVSKFRAGARGECRRALSMPWVFERVQGGETHRVHRARSVGAPQSQAPPRPNRAIEPALPGVAWPPFLFLDKPTEKLRSSQRYESGPLANPSHTAITTALL